MTMTGVDERLSGRVRVLRAALAIDVDERTGDDVHDDRTEAWVCHGNCAPGCTVYRTTTVCDGSPVLTTTVSES